MLITLRENDHAAWSPTPARESRAETVSRRDDRWLLWQRINIVSGQDDSTPSQSNRDPLSLLKYEKFFFLIRFRLQTRALNSWSGSIHSYLCHVH